MDDKKVKKQKDQELAEDKKAEEELEVENEEVEDDEVTELEEKIKGLEDQLKRAVADYRNLENRNRDEKLEFIKFANKSLVEQLLPAFDTLLLADKFTDDQNLKITVKHVLDVLKNAGIERVETAGVDYNPTTMEAIEVVSGPANKVVEEVQPGFTLYGKIVRPARVKVGEEK